MGLIKCKDCGAEISEDCTTCPNCGANILKQTNPNLQNNLQKQSGCMLVLCGIMGVVGSIWIIIAFKGNGFILFTNIMLFIIGAYCLLNGIGRMLNNKKDE